ncbi:MAG TPA: phosphate ABC transporter permease PstA, partial [Phycisphaerales bacterium]|nr:phosphate ABC transporter permease PstA [Phycisphaerales bacterium]
MSSIASSLALDDRAPGPESRFALRRLRSSAMFWGCAAATLAVIAILIVVMGYLIVLGAPGITWSLFTQDPTGDPQAPGGLRHAIVGTLELLALSGIVGVPMGMLAGVYLSEYSRTGRGYFGRVVRFVSDVLAGVPSIVVGILGYELVVVPMGHHSGWSGALALGFIMVPIIARTTEEMLRLVPDSYRAGSLALGATKSQTIMRVVLPAATGSLVTGVMLALARVAGETAPLLFTAMG